MKIELLTLSIGCALVSSGCVERRVEYVPAYQVPPANVGAPAYTYQPQTAYAAPPVQAANAPVADVAPQATVTPPAYPNAAVVAQAPPPPQVETIPVAPGPAYVWAPGYWSIGVGGAWIWVGGHYVVRPHPHAIWVGGHWARHGHGYVWVGGYWH
jgi:hypothetical protein